MQTLQQGLKGPRISKSCLCKTRQAYPPVLIGLITPGAEMTARVPAHMKIRRLSTDQLWQQIVKCIVFQAMLVLLAWPASVLLCYIFRHKPCKNWALFQTLLKFFQISQNPECTLLYRVYSWWTWFSIYPLIIWWMAKSTPNAPASELPGRSVQVAIWKSFQSNSGRVTKGVRNGIFPTIWVNKGWHRHRKLQPPCEVSWRALRELKKERIPAI